MYNRLRMHKGLRWMLFLSCLTLSVDWSYGNDGCNLDGDRVPEGTSYYGYECKDGEWVEDSA